MLRTKPRAPAAAVALLGLGLFFAPAQAAAPPVTPEILQAEVYDGRLWILSRPLGAIDIWSQPLDGSAPAVIWEQATISHIQAPRWHLAHGALWLI